MTPALVSIIIPCYNAARYLSEAISSALAQTYGGVEVVVVDDGSTDDSPQVAATYGDRILYVRQDNSGASAARNRGILESRGEFLCFLDSDDTLCPDAISRLVPEFADEKVGLVYSAFQTIDEQGTVVGESCTDRCRSGDVFASIVEGPPTIHAPVVRRTALAKAGLYDTRLKQIEDIDLYLRIAHCYEFRFVPEQLMMYRLREGSLGRQFGFRRESGSVYLAAIRVWRANGRMTAGQYRRIKSRVRSYEANMRAQDAFVAYQSGDHRRAASLSLYAITHKLCYFMNRGLWSIMLRSQLRSMRKGA